MIEKIPDHEIDMLKRMASDDGGKESAKLAVMVHIAKKLNDIIDQLNRNNIIPY